MPHTKPALSGIELLEKVGLSRSGESLLKQIQQGFDYGVFDALLKELGLSKQEAANALNISARTLARRAKEGRFTTEESDRLYRMAQLTEAAQILFEGNTEAVRRWVCAPAKALGGRRPIDMISTSVEAQFVFDLIGRLEYGVVV